MSATIYYRPLNSGVVINTRSSSKFLEVAGQGPYDKDSIEFLRGCAACGLEGADQLIEAILKYGDVEVYAEY